MNTENLKKARKSKKITMQKAAELIGVSVSSYQKYEYGINKPDIDILKKISKEFGVTTDYLLGLETPPENPLAFLHLNDDDEEVMRKYASLPENVRKMLLDIMIQLGDAARNGRAEQVRQDIIMTIQKHLNRASAGTGYDLSNDDEWVEIDVVKDGNAERADFAVQIEGDSMLPEYHDGDVVFIVQDPDVPVGKVGLFVQNGKGYIKERGKDCLISTNPDYKDIYPDDGEIICIGRVIGIAELVK